MIVFDGINVAIDIIHYWIGQMFNVFVRPLFDRFSASPLGIFTGPIPGIIGTYYYVTVTIYKCSIELS